MNMGISLTIINSLMNFLMLHFQEGIAVCLSQKGTRNYIEAATH